MLRLGWSFAQEAEPGVGYAGMGAGMALEDSEWRADRGAAAVAACDWKGIRLWSRGRPDPHDQAVEAIVASEGRDAVQVLNEPNLCELGKPADVEEWPGTAEECAAWHGTLLDAAGAEHRIWLTPFSPAPGARLREWLAAHRHVAKRCKGLLAHAYGTAEEMWDALEPVRELARELGLPVAIAECGPRADQDHEAWGRDELPRFAERVAREAPDVVALCVFAPAWSRPDGSFSRPVRFQGTDVERWLREWKPPAEKPAPFIPEIFRQEPPVSYPTIKIGGVELIDVRERYPYLPDTEYPERPLAAIDQLVQHHLGMPDPDHPIPTTIEDALEWIDSVHRYHQEHHGWPAIGYGVVADGAGRLYLVNGLQVAGHHARRANATGIGLLWLWTFDGKPPPDPFVDATRRFKAGAEKHLGRALTLWGHYEITGPSDTSCPGIPHWPATKARILGSKKPVVVAPPPAAAAAFDPVAERHWLWKYAVERWGKNGHPWMEQAIKSATALSKGEK